MVRGSSPSLRARCFLPQGFFRFSAPPDCGYEDRPPAGQKCMERGGKCSTWIVCKSSNCNIINRSHYLLLLFVRGASDIGDHHVVFEADADEL